LKESGKALSLMISPTLALFVADRQEAGRSGLTFFKNRPFHSCVACHFIVFFVFVFLGKNVPHARNKK
jgi:hypothetical protein